MINSVLFKGMTETEIGQCLHSLKATEKQYKKDALILTAGDTTKRFGLVLSGSVTIESNDVWGNRTILSHIGEGQFFAETYALLEDETLPSAAGDRPSARRDHGAADAAAFHL